MAQALKTLPRADSVRASVPMAERLFASLDGRDLLVGGEAWHIEVYGICEDAGRRWVQMAIDGPQHHMLTLVLATRAGVRQAVAAVSRWIEDPSDRPLMLRVG
jgi:hypothetical protein